MNAYPAHIGVIGSGTPDERVDADAEQVGALVAEAGAVLVCGGLGGVMEAACRGARAAGGRTVGLLPGDDRSAANPYVEVAIPTGLGEARNLLVVRASDVLIAVGGAFGTLSEIAFALRAGRGVVGLRTWQLTAPEGKGAPLLVAHSPAEAVSVATDRLMVQ